MQSRELVEGVVLAQWYRSANVPKMVGFGGAVSVKDFSRTTPSVSSQLCKNDLQKWPLEAKP